ncbi:ArsB/NhaD family transporter [Heliobacterium chlorum]|uniref:ArsB/NhaD family transporter n=1 Tax=Heliobacterium chlorum TaxID=2698 RepID=A0ABR7T169_HELCL|nr:ArsB/NhaD family transporter [Heliobacterium chlorum]
MTAQTQVIVAVIIFLLTYGFIISEKMHRMVVAMLGAVVFLLVGILSQEDAIHAIDFNTLGLLIGMMIIVGITRRTGVFEFIAVKAVKVAKGEPLRILVLLSTVTAVASAFLDNVTTVLLVVPVTFSIAQEMDVNPMPFLISEILASNIGGTATLIGDPPNIMIGSSTGLSFNDFILNLTLPIVIIFIANMVILRFLYRNDLVTTEERKARVVAFDEREQIKDWALLKKSLFVLALTILGFILHGLFGLESATIALAGAILLLAITREEPEDILLHVEWPTIFFFVGLFVLVGGLEHLGIICWIAQEGLKLTGGLLGPTAMFVLWISAIASAFVDNIPFVATMIPMIKAMGEMSGMNLNPLWWSLALGACLGGNGTLIGASANVIVAGLAEKNGFPISFMGFMKVAFPLMLISIVISTVYVGVRYLGWLF